MRTEGYAPRSQLFIKLFLAAPDSGLPSLLIALGSQASRLHLFTKEVLAAPRKSLAAAWASHWPLAAGAAPWAKAPPRAKAVKAIARTMDFMLRFPRKKEVAI